eukprot:COSAG05_NODE_2405_length_3103_cov_1.927097_1_plen_859_part_00
MAHLAFWQPEDLILIMKALSGVNTVVEMPNVPTDGPDAREEIAKIPPVAAPDESRQFYGVATYDEQVRMLQEFYATHDPSKDEQGIMAIVNARKGQRPELSPDEWKDLCAKLKKKYGHAVCPGFGPEEQERQQQQKARAASLYAHVKLEYMWADAGVITGLAKLNPLRWVGGNPTEFMEALKAEATKKNCFDRKLLVRVVTSTPAEESFVARFGGLNVHKEFKNVVATTDFVQQAKMAFITQARVKAAEGGTAIRQEAATAISKSTPPSPSLARAAEAAELEPELAAMVESGELNEETAALAVAAPSPTPEQGDDGAAAAPVFKGKEPGSEAFEPKTKGEVIEIKEVAKGNMMLGTMASIPPVSCSPTEQIFGTKELQWTDASGGKRKHEVRFLVPNGTTSEDESGYIMRLFTAPVEEGVPGQSGTAPRAQWLVNIETISAESRPDNAKDAPFCIVVPVPTDGFNAWGLNAWEVDKPTVRTEISTRFSELEQLCDELQKEFPGAEIKKDFPRKKLVGKFDSDEDAEKVRGWFSSVFAQFVSVPGLGAKLQDWFKQEQRARCGLMRQISVKKREVKKTMDTAADLAAEHGDTVAKAVGAGVATVAVVAEEIGAAVEGSCRELGAAVEGTCREIGAAVVEIVEGIVEIVEGKFQEIGDASAESRTKASRCLAIASMICVVWAIALWSDVLRWSEVQPPPGENCTAPWLVQEAVEDMNFIGWIFFGCALKLFLLCLRAARKPHFKFYQECGTPATIPVMLTAFFMMLIVIDGIVLWTSLALASGRHSTTSDHGCVQSPVPLIIIAIVLLLLSGGVVYIIYCSTKYKRQRCKNRLIVMRFVLKDVPGCALPLYSVYHSRLRE